MTTIQGLPAAGGGLPTLVDAGPGAGATGDLPAPRGGAGPSPLERASDAPSTLSAEAVQCPAQPGGGELVGRLVARGPAGAPDAAAAERAAQMSFGEVMGGYRDLTRVTVELGVVASASSSFTTATGKLLSGS